MPTGRSTVQGQATKRNLRCVTFCTKIIKSLKYDSSPQVENVKVVLVTKILSEFYEINPEELFQVNNMKMTRDNANKLRGQSCNTIACNLYFNIKVVDHWNRQTGFHSLAINF